jgi:hypothetical protein
MKTPIITSHKLAEKLFAFPDLPVFTFGENSGEFTRLIPLSAVDKMQSFKGEEPDGECIVVGPACAEAEEPNAKLRDAAPAQTQTLSTNE